MASKIANKNPEHINKNKILRQRISESIFLNPVTPTEVEKYIMNLKNSSAPGPDNISAFFVKKFRHYLVHPLSHVINLCIETGEIPVQWKESVVIPIFKTGEREQLCNYRPISLINNFAKIFELSIKDRLLSFVEKHNIFVDGQFGFRKKLSTKDAALKLIEQIVTSLNNNEKCLAVFLDVAKAFDTVNHNILLDRLENLGIRDRALQLIKNYLEGRTQTVRIDHTKSDPLVIKTGVPQGTVLGPHLFLLYINGMSQMAAEVDSIISYADDTVLVFKAKSWDEAYSRAEVGFGRVQRWLEISYLTLNLDKTKFMTFSITSVGQPSRSQLRLRCSTYHMGNACRRCSSIDRVNSIKYLGLMLDCNLKWEEHTKHVSNNLTKLMYKFYQLRDILDKKNLYIVYNALAESKIRYCIIVWGGLYNKHLQIIQTIQNSLLKILFKKDIYYPTVKLYQELNLFDVRKLYTYESILWVFKSHVKQASTNYSTRSKKHQPAEVPTPHKTYFKKFIFFLGPSLYNRLPLDIKQETNFSNLKKRLKILILEDKEGISTLFL